MSPLAPREDTFVREVGSVLDDEGMDREEL